jgi:hypothetical protein
MNTYPQFPPDVRFTHQKPTLREMRDRMDRAEQLIREFSYCDSIEVNGEVYTGADIADDLASASSALYLHERSLK